MSRIYGYLRASTKKQDANRARSQLEIFCKGRGLKVSAFFVENESGSKLDRPELFRLLDVAQKGDVLLVEQVDRISRLNEEDWKKLKTLISEKGLIVVALDLPTSHDFAENKNSFTGWILEAINGMMLDMLAAVARKDFEDRRERQRQGIKKAKAKKLYKGRPTDVKLHTNIERLLKSGSSYSEIEDTLACSRATIAKVSKKIREKKI